METKTETIRSQALALGLFNARNRLDTLLHTAEHKDMTHLEFLEYLLGEEILCRLSKARDRRIREACFPYEKRLESFDISFCPSLTAKNLRQLGGVEMGGADLQPDLPWPAGSGKDPPFAGVRVSGRTGGL